MDSNIDPNIDPSMESQSGIFTKFSINNDFHNQNDNEHDDFINQQYIDDNHQNNSSSAAAATAAAAAAAAAANLSNIINFNQLQGLQDRSNTSSPPPSNTQQPNSQVEIKNGNDSTKDHSTRDSMNFIQDTLNNLESSQDQHNQHHHQQHHHQQQQHREQQQFQQFDNRPKQRIIHDTDSQVSIVVVNPGSKEGTRRLGRPRKHVSSSTSASNTPVPEINGSNNSSQNENESILSRFRIDSRPVTGPGSRGGRKKVKSLVSKPGRQFKFEKGTKKLQLTLSNNEPDKNGDDEGRKSSTSSSKDKQTKTSPVEKKLQPLLQQSTHSKTTNDVVDDDLIVLDEIKNPSSTSSESHNGTKIILEDYHSLKAKGRSTARDDQQHNKTFAKFGLMAPTAKNQKRLKQLKKRKDHPGPLVVSHYEIYEPDLVKYADSSKDPELNMIAMGFEVKPAPYAKDIMIILEFISKFQDIMVDFIDLGPQDIEEGLSLNPSTLYALENVKQKTVDHLFSKDSTTLKDNEERLMELFWKLLSLTLNKSSNITKSVQKNALKDLKISASFWGLPDEWRDDSDVFNIYEPFQSESSTSLEPQTSTNDISMKDAEPVDLENPTIFDTSSSTYGITKPISPFPLDDDNFIQDGIFALNPKDRLILLRTLVQWSLSNSDIIKNQITTKVQAQNPSLEKETYYVSRYAKEGMKSYEESIAKYKKQLVKQSSIKKTASPATGTPVPESTDNGENKGNTDPSMSPLNHPSSIRLLTFYAGDGGINGRFYLCRQSDSQTGTLGGYEDLKKVLEDNRPIEEIHYEDPPSKFKLYVQDVTTMLLDIYKPVDEESITSQVALDPWYEIAGDVESLKYFLQHLAAKLTQNRSIQLTNLFNYLNSLLPTLEKFETIRREGKTISNRTRRGKRSAIDDIEENNDGSGSNKRPGIDTDDNHEHEHEEDEDADFEFIEPVNDDADDDDYIEDHEDHE